jgi:hypothetical protein
MVIKREAAYKNLSNDEIRRQIEHTERRLREHEELLKNYNANPDAYENLPRNITTQELRQIFELLMDFIEKRNVKKISLKQDYYVSVPPEKLDAFIKNPEGNSEYGQISEDIVYLEKLLTDPANYMPDTVAIEKFGAIMTAIGQEFYEEDEK